MRTVGQSAATGMAMASARFARSAYNVANINTPDFQARSVDAVQAIRSETSEQAKAAAMANAPFSARAPEGPLLSARAPEGPLRRADAYHGEMGVSSTDLTTETLQQISAVNAFKANLAMLRADDDRTRRLLDLKA